VTENTSQSQRQQGTDEPFTTEESFDSSDTVTQPGAVQRERNDGTYLDGSDEGLQSRSQQRKLDGDSHQPDGFKRPQETQQTQRRNAQRQSQGDGAADSQE
jgi:hypothetical protein